MVEQAEFAVLARRLGDRVKRFRARRGMSRKDLPGHAGISERYLAQLVDHGAAIKFSIAAVLGATVGRLGFVLHGRSVDVHRAALHSHRHTQRAGHIAPEHGR